MYKSKISIALAFRYIFKVQSDCTEECTSHTCKQKITFVLWRLPEVEKTKFTITKPYDMNQGKIPGLLSPVAQSNST